MKGYTGKILNVNLTDRTCKTEVISDSIYEKYLSGVGLASYLLYKRIPRNADPLGPENILAFTSGMLTGAGTLFTGRFTVSCKSPLTGTWGDANCGGQFAPAIKRCGYDGIFISGISDKPVYLYVDNTVAELRDASELWGLDAIETEETLQKNASKKIPAIACIGPSGENLSLISGICNDRGRIAARSGVGAVMGSKKLKAIALAGTRPVKYIDVEGVKALSKALGTSIKEAKPVPVPGFGMRYLGKMASKNDEVTVSDSDPVPMLAGLFKKWGTGGMNQKSIEEGDSPLKNWSGSREDYPKKLSKQFNPDVVGKKEISKYHCYSCPIGCGAICKIDDISEFKETHRPEYETALAFGGLLLNKDLDTVLFINEYLNRAGMDTISAGGTVAFAIECYEHGIITKEDTGGIELTWGNSKGIREIVKLMVKREGFGNVLADGSKKASEIIGKNSDRFAIHAGGQELAMHDGRLDPGFAVHYSVEPTPGRHTVGAFQYYNAYRLWDLDPTLPKPQEKYAVKDHFEANLENAKKLTANSHYKMVIDGCGACLFAGNLGPSFPIFKYINSVAGWDKTPHDYLEIGQRIQTTRQMFNIKQGIDPRMNRLSPRAYGDPPLTKGPNAGATVPVNEYMSFFWKAEGWDPLTGIPSEETLKKLDINDVVEFV